MTVTNATSSLSYHTSLGFVHIIPRPTLGLAKNNANGKLRILTNFGSDKASWDLDYLVLYKPATKATKVYVTLGCGAIVRFDYGACRYLEGEGKHSVELEQLELVEELPLEVNVKDLHPELEAFSF